MTKPAHYDESEKEALDPYDAFEESQKNMPLLSSYERIAHARGKNEGIRATQRQTALNLHKLGLPVAQIAQGLELDPAEVEAILNSDPSSEPDLTTPSLD